MILNDLREIGSIRRTNQLVFPFLSNYAANSVCFSTHWHESIEILVVTDGEAFFEISGQTYLGVPGDIFIVNPRCIHTGYTKEKSVKYYALLMEFESQIGGNNFVDRLMQPVFAQNTAFLPHIRDEEIYKLFLQLTQERYNDYEGKDLVFLGLIYTIFGKLFKDYVDTHFVKPKTDGRFEEVLDFVNDNFHTPITTETICKKFKYDEAYFCRKFKKITGLSPMLYLRIMRLERAKYLLNNTAYDMHSICEGCGFRDINYFQRCFKEQYGITPSVYRREKSNEK